MKNYFLSIFSIFILFACEKENFETVNNENLVEENGIIESEENLSQKSTTYLDESGRIEFVISTRGSVNQDYSGNILRNLELDINVPSGYVCVGGGAQVYSNYPSDPGTLLTMSAPKTGSDAFRGWRAEAKEHVKQNRYVWRMFVYAVGIRMKDNNGNWIPASELKNNLIMTTSTSSSAQSPSAIASISTSGYSLISGGAKVNWSGVGNLLTQSYPSSSNTWTVRSKDHLKYSPATITAYAIGIKNNIPNFGEVSIVRGSNCSYTSSGYDSVNSASPSGYRSTGVGARSTFNGSYGRMLYQIVPSSSGIGALSKDHLKYDSGDTCAYYIAMKKK